MTNTEKLKAAIAKFDSDGWIDNDDQAALFADAARLVIAAQSAESEVEIVTNTIFSAFQEEHLIARFADADFIAGPALNRAREIANAALLAASLSRSGAHVTREQVAKIIADHSADKLAVLVNAIMALFGGDWDAGASAMREACRNKALGLRRYGVGETASHAQAAHCEEIAAAIADLPIPTRPK
jgi:hypothetical protein